MAQIPQYKIVYTESAIQDIEEKADYIRAGVESLTAKYPIYR